ncbi:hypothetical protein [Sphingomonas sp. Leaf412]|uniref:hypothetical protein n=1 Tax=Sphingomonas sp. Leaf412 TaxID=1736370 RepID=UPI0012E3E7C5|nr:hypothetical protein [Sphingomonas sp. Leaf412]
MALAAIAVSRGIATGVAGVELTARSSWTPAAADRFSVSLEGIDDRLMPAPIIKDVADPALLRREFAWDLAKLRRRLSARKACASVGGVAWADELTLRAISQFGAEAEIPDPFGRTVGLAHADLVLFWHQGVLRSLGGTAAGIGWCGTSMSIEGWSLPDTLMAAVQGRPVTELISHQLLSDRLRICDIVNVQSATGPRLELSLDMPLVPIDRMGRAVGAGTDMPGIVC